MWYDLKCGSLISSEVVYNRHNVKRDFVVEDIKPILLIRDHIATKTGSTRFTLVYSEMTLST